MTMDAYDFAGDICLCGRIEPLRDRDKKCRGAVRYTDLGLVWRPQGSVTIYHSWFIPQDGAEVREVCSYDFDRAMGFGYIPKSVWRKEASDYGSLQRWLPDSFREWELTDDRQDIRRPSFSDVGKRRAIELWLLDAVLMNVDSVHTNYLWCGQTREIARIDNGECLPPPGLVASAKARGERRYNWPLPWPRWHGLLNGQRLPRSLLDRLAAVCWSDLTERWCTRGIEKDAATAAETRASLLLARKTVDTEAVWGLPYLCPR